MAKTKKKPGFKAKNMKVYISGFRGQHPIELGVAYYYRGHYIYGPAYNPIDVLTYSTKKEIRIAGVPIKAAPSYHQMKRNLIDEERVAALHKQMIVEWENMPKDCMVETDASSNTSVIHVAGMPESLIGFSQVPGMIPKYTVPASKFYNDHALYLAASAPSSPPVSASPSPDPSRPGTPPYGAPAVLKLAASTTRLNQLLAEEGIVRSQAALPEFHHQLDVTPAPGLSEQGLSSGLVPTSVLSRSQSLSKLSSTQPLPESTDTSDVETSDRLTMSKRVGRQNKFDTNLAPPPSRPARQAPLRDPFASSRSLSRVASVGSIYDKHATSSSNTLSILKHKAPSCPVSRIASVSQLHGNDGLANKCNPLGAIGEGAPSRPLSRVASSSSIHKKDEVVVDSKDLFAVRNKPYTGLRSATTPTISLPRVASPHSDGRSSVSGSANEMMSMGGYISDTGEFTSKSALRSDEEQGGSPTEASNSYDQREPRIASFDNHIPGLGSSTTRYNTDFMSQSAILPDRAPFDNNPFTSQDSTRHHLPTSKSPLHTIRPTGRPRKDSMTKASIALNSAVYNFNINDIKYENLTKCPIHDSSCDGKTVTGTYLTDAVRQKGGFIDLYPVLQAGERVMVDWEGLLREEKRVRGEL